MSVLVTGGAGFIGSHLVERLCAHYEGIYVIDDLSTGRLSNLESCSSQIEFIEADISNVDLSHVPSIGTIVHLAAQTSVPFSVEHFRESSHENLAGTLAVVALARERCVPLVYASSSAVYGELELGNDTLADTDLLTPYAADKYAMEVYASMAHRLYGVASIGMRFFNVYGPRQDPRSPYSGVISIFADRLLGRRSVDLNGGWQTRDFVFVRDVVDGITSAIRTLERTSMAEVVNVLTGVSTSIESLLSEIAELVGVDPSVVRHALPPGDPGRSGGTVEKMQSLLGLRPSEMTSLRRGLEETINHLRTAESRLG